MIRILHLSDIHCGPHFRADVADALLTQIPSLRAQIIVVAGDLTQRAKRAEFAQARALLDRLPSVPTVTIPGNHDVPLYRVWERLLQPHRNYQEAIHPRLNNVVSCDQATVIALDSSAPRSAIVNGWISKAQIEFCRTAFAQCGPDALRVVVAHHPVLAAPDYERGKPMRYAKRFVRACEEMGVDLILGGHLHRHYVGVSTDVYPHPIGDVAHTTCIVQSGTATSGRGRAREKKVNSVNLIELDKGKCCVTSLQFDRSVMQFLPVRYHELASMWTVRK